MVRNRHEISELSFAGPPGRPAGIEVLSLAELRARAGPELLGRPQRPAFHHLLTLDRGALWHTVDFTRYAVVPGSWLWVRPGQVQQWGDLTAAEGTLILFEPDFLDPGTSAHLDDPYAPVLADPAGDGAAVAARHLVHAFGSRGGLPAFGGGGGLPAEVHAAVLRHLLAVLVLHLAHRGTPTAGPAPGDTFVRFRDAVERDFTGRRRVEDYARELGYSVRTLSRATRAAAGVNAKEFIDRRTVLEARRLLAHSDHTAARIAARLGFTSATNFSKFFQQRTGTSPIGFRAGVRGAATRTAGSAGRPAL